MKRILLLLLFALTCLFVGLVNGCKKDSVINSPGGLAVSFTEEFDSVYKLVNKGWMIKDNSEFTTDWVQAGAVGKGGSYTAFPAYSYSISQDEYITAAASLTGSYYSISSWLITPILSVKNGDKISFYTRADTGTGGFKDRMQVRMNKSTSVDVGSTPNTDGLFNTVLIDINSALTGGGYPTTWTKYEYTFTGLSGNVTTRIAFRYFVPSTASAIRIGIDLFKFEKI